VRLFVFTHGLKALPYTFMENPENQIPGDGKERVALEMAKFIFEKIVLFDTANEKPLARKAYFFKLYGECLAVIVSQKPPSDA